MDELGERLPQPLTLSWLSSKRWEATEMLSQLGSFLTTKAIMIKLASNGMLASQLQSATYQMQALTLHVSAAFGTCSGNDQETKKTWSSAQQQIHHLQTLVDALTTALRNCDRAMQATAPSFTDHKTTGSLSQHDQSEAFSLEGNDDELQEWWQHVTDLLNRFQVVKSQMDNTLWRSSAPSDSTSTDLANVEDNMQLHTSTINISDPIILFEDEQDSVRDDARDVETTPNVNEIKTKVFSGLGTVPLLRHRPSASATLHEEDHAFVENHARQPWNRVNEQLLIQELAVRLKMLPQCEEVEDNEMAPQVSNFHSEPKPTMVSVESSRSAHVFLGATGLLLDELKQSMSNNFETFETS
jgi:hypothetical protein